MTEGINSNEILFFYTRLDRAGDRELEKWTQQISPEEAVRAQEFSLEKKKKEFIISRALVRDILSRYSDIPAKELEFISNSHGKPELKSRRQTRLRFSLSHSGNLVACGVALDFDLGIDVEDCDRKVNLGIAERFFTEPEIRHIREPGPGNIRVSEERFLRIWTLKESYIKAKGRGLSIPLNQFSFDLSRKDPVIQFNETMGDQPEDWSFFSFDLSLHKAAAALHSTSVKKNRLKIFHCVPFEGVAFERSLSCPC